MLSHVLVTNMTYTDNDPAFEPRLEWYKTKVLPKILEQTDMNFDIAIKCNPAHADKIKAVYDKLIIFGEKDWASLGGAFFTNKAGERIRKFCSWKNVVGLDKYDIQSNLDSDDFIAPNYIEKVKEEVMKTDLTKSMHIHFQPEALNTDTGQTRTINKRYSDKTGSAFYSLYQPDKTNYIFVRNDTHIRMAKGFDKTILIPEGYCWIACNKNNYKTKYRSV